MAEKKISIALKGYSRTIVISVLVIGGVIFFSIYTLKKHAAQKGSVSVPGVSDSKIHGKPEKGEVSQRYREQIRQRDREQSKNTVAFLADPQGSGKSDSLSKNDIAPKKQEKPPSSAGPGEKILANNNAGLNPAGVRQQASSDQEALKARMAAIKEREKAIVGEMVSINNSLYPAQNPDPPVFNYRAAEKMLAKKDQNTVNRGGKSGRGSSSSGKKSGRARHHVHIPDNILALLRPGRIYYGTMDSKVDSDIPGPVLATVQSGQLQGAKLLGGFKKAHDFVVIQFTSMTMPNGDVYPLSAYAVDSKNLQDGLSVNVNHHYFERYGALLAGAFLYGFGQAEMYAGGTGTVTQFGTPVFIPNTNTLMSQTMMGLGTAGQQLSSLASAGFNRPSTVTVPKGQAVGILIMHAGSPKKQPQATQTAATGPSRPQQQAPMGFQPPGAGVPMAGYGGYGGGYGGYGGGPPGMMPMMPMMP